MYINGNLVPCKAQVDIAVAAQDAGDFQPFALIHAHCASQHQLQAVHLHIDVSLHTVHLMEKRRVVVVLVYAAARSA